jgi:hypothetical protein
VIWHFGSLGLVPYIKHTKLCGNKHTKQKHLPSLFSEHKPLNCSTRMKKPSCQGKPRGGIGRMMREHKARLYIIRQCIVMLLCHHDWSVISSLCSSKQTAVLFWPPFQNSESVGLDNSLMCIHFFQKKNGGNVPGLWCVYPDLW